MHDVKCLLVTLASKLECMLVPKWYRFFFQNTSKHPPACLILDAQYNGKTLYRIIFMLCTNWYQSTQTVLTEQELCFCKENSYITLPGIVYNVLINHFLRRVNFKKKLLDLQVEGYSILLSEKHTSSPFRQRTEQKASKKL